MSLKDEMLAGEAITFEQQEALVRAAPRLADPDPAADRRVPGERLTRPTPTASSASSARCSTGCAWACSSSASAGSSTTSSCGGRPCSRSPIVASSAKRASSRVARRRRSSRRSPTSSRASRCSADPLGFGDLVIYTQSGEAGADRFKTITNPKEFRDQHAEHQDRRWRPLPPGTGGRSRRRRPGDRRPRRSGRPDERRPAPDAHAPRRAPRQRRDHARGVRGQEDRAALRI